MLPGYSTVRVQVMTQADLQNVRKSLAAACDNQQHQAEQLAKQQQRLDSASEEVAEAKARTSCAEKARDAEAAAATGLRSDLDTVRQRVQELQQQLCKARAAAARAKNSSSATSPRKQQGAQNSHNMGVHGDKIVIPTQSGYQGAETVPDFSSQTVDMSGLIRQMNASNRKLTRAVKVRTTTAVQCQ